jgi:hypothetical protein
MKSLGLKHHKQCVNHCWDVKKEAQDYVDDQRLASARLKCDGDRRQEDGEKNEYDFIVHS